jgi:nucleoside-diphosphate-sugar epimerase
MNILVTGGSGFIGSNLINKLLKKNYRIINFDLHDSDFIEKNENYIFKKIQLTPFRR